MMEEVPKSDVVITNPTHYAVAIRYDMDVDRAPKVVAKGQRLMALKIKEIARASGVKIVDDPPLARTLYNSVEVDEEIFMQGIYFKQINSNFLLTLLS